MSKESQDLELREAAQALVEFTHSQPEPCSMTMAVKITALKAALAAPAEPAEVEQAKKEMRSRLVVCNASDRPHSYALCSCTEGHTNARIFHEPAAPTPAQPEAGTGKLEDATVINDLDKLVANIRSEDTRGCSTGQANTPASTDDVVERMLHVFDETKDQDYNASPQERRACMTAALAVAREGCYTLEQIEKGVREVGGTRHGWPAFARDLRHYLENELPTRQRLSAGTERDKEYML